MDKRHPSSFQQLEKLGEGTYATVRSGIRSVCLFSECANLDNRYSRAATGRPANSLRSRRSTSTAKKAHLAPPSVRSVS